MIEFSNVFFKNKDAWKDDNIKYVINQGGTSSTKTYSILQLLTLLSIKKPYKIDIVGLSVPHLKSGVLNDMQTVCRSLGFPFDAFYKEGDKVFKRGEGSINFLAFDKLGKAHGGRRDVLYMNEANHLNYNIAEQLMIRTRKKVFIDYNPTNAFWVHKNILVNEPDKAILIKSTYKDNPFLEQSIIDSIESRRGDGNNNFWRVYGMGELGIAEGLIFNNFEQADFDIERFSEYRNGIDWGFSNDPFAFVRVAIENDCLYVCKEIYQTNLLNKDSAPMVKEIVKNEIVTCDSAEPKSVADFRTYGINAMSARKGAGSIESGIKFLQSFKKIYIHKNCPNIYDEFCNYQWKIDKNGEALPQPVDAFNHCLVKGTKIITKDGIKNIEDITTSDYVLTRKGYKKVVWSGISDKNRKVYKVLSDKGNLIFATNNHKVLTLNGFCDIDSLRYDDKILIRRYKCQKANLLKCLGVFGDVILNLKDVLTENILRAVVYIYTILFGKNLLVKEKKDMLYTIKTVIAKIMTSQTWKRLHLFSICKDTHNQKKSEKNTKKFLKRITTCENGIKAKKALNGINNTQKNIIGEFLTCLKSNAKIVAKHSSLKHITTSFVQMLANRHIEEQVELITLLSIANGADTNLLQTNIKMQDFVVGRVLIVQEAGKASEVYDLTVDDCHEFFANGILVHNCIDATRYALESDMAHNKVTAIKSLWD